MFDVLIFENSNQLLTNIKCRLKNNFKNFNFDFTIFENQYFETTFERGSKIEDVMIFLEYALKEFPNKNGYAVFYNYKPSIEAPILVIIQKEKYDKIKDKINSLGYEVLSELLEPIILVSDVATYDFSCKA